MRRAAALALAGSCAAVAAPAHAQAPRPATVPALQEWRPADGRFALRRDAHVVVRGALRGEARTLAQDLAALQARPVRVRTRGPARTGDVVLVRDRGDGALGAEGYALRVGRAFTITSPTTAGAFYGGRTLLQLVRGGDPIPRGRGRDIPRYAQRGLMVDNGRVFFSRAWLEARVAQLADLKLNRLHLHFSDNQGFRIRSTSHPEVVTEPALSHDDLRRLVAVARRHHVTLVPELDAPGHLQAVLRAHPDKQLVNLAGQRQADKLDVTNPAARQLILDLVDELAPLFPGPLWHAGADEYLGILSTPLDYALYPQLEAYADARHGPGANGKDAVLDFVEELRQRVARHGKRLQVWSDGIGGGAALRLHPDVGVMWWEELHSPAPAALVAAGHEVLNAGWWPLYHVTGGPLKDLRAPVAAMYEDWRPHQFSGPYSTRSLLGAGPPTGTLDAREPAQLGATLQVWNDDPASPDAREEAVAAGIAPRLAVLAQRTWGSPDPAPGYTAFARLATRVTRSGT